MLDIEGTVLEVGMSVYILDAARSGSSCKRLLRGRVVQIKGSKCEVLVAENKRHYWKTSATVVVPFQ